MRAIAINGSHRKGKNTAILLRTILEELSKKGVETRLFELVDLRIEYCRACNRCLSEPKCSIEDDDMAMLAEEMLRSDVIIIGSPVYNANVTSKLKTFIDRTRWMHMKRELLQGKLGASVTVAGLRNGGQELAHAIIERFFLSRGMKIVGVRDPERGIYNMGVMATLYDHLEGEADLPSIKWKKTVSDDPLAMATCRFLASNILKALKE
ncbi:MAG: flavodoxin family protein [Syntrophobacterales bacterium]|nr:flavodoxin family protein [Syntrophobacterales bacterium]